MPSPALTATVTVSPGAPEPLCRTLLTNNSLTSETAASARAEHPSVAVRGKPAVYTDRPGGTDGVRYTSVDTATQRPNGDTR